MTFRTTVRDGLIVVNTHGAIPDGTPVEIVRLDAPKKGRSKRATTKPTRLPAGFGGWHHRTDIKDSAEFARTLRKRASRRPTRG